jgi:cytoskeleton protein RodZ
LAALAPDGSSDDAATDHPTGATPPSQPEGSTTLGQSPTVPPSTGPQMPAASIDGGVGTANAATPRASIDEAPAPATNGADGSASPPAATAAITPTETPPAADVAGSTVSASPSQPTPPAQAGDQAATSGDNSGTAGTGNPAPSGTSVPPVAPAVATNDIPAAPTVSGIAGQGGAQQEAAAPSASSAEGVVLEARMDSWIKVVDAKGKTVTQQVLKAGERYVVPDEPGLVLRTGNAGGLDILVNGRKAPPLGEVGAVVTKISLAPDRLLGGTAAAN